MIRRTTPIALLIAPLSAVAQTPTTPDTPVAAEAASEIQSVSGFGVRLDPAVFAKGYTGRVYLVFATGESREPRTAMGDWFGKTQFIAMDVKDLAPGATIDLSAATLGWPKAPKDIPAGEYTVQAVARVNLDNPSAGRGDGDLYSAPLKVRYAPSGSSPTTQSTTLTLDKTIKARPFRESETVQLFEMKSPSLSAFLGRDRTIRAGVVLPKGWAENPDKTYPTVYWIGGFGSDHRSAAGIARMLGDDCLIVVPDPQCYRGHSVFADSANNGPWGQALVNELIPAVEAKYRGAADSTRRHVTGMSSGGWSSLWLMVEYPDTFTACWSHCPDPVDFRDFQRINLYEPGANMYKDAAGERRPLARGAGDKPSLYYQDFVAQEVVMGPGGQIHAFEAVFSPRLASGEPRPLFDRQTGAVDTETARLWEKYDIRLKLERGWETLGPKLKGKIHIYAGGKDTFYLEGAALRLKESLTALGSDAVVEIIPDMPHRIHTPGVEAMKAAIRGDAPSDVTAPREPAKP